MIGGSYISRCVVALAARLAGIRVKLPSEWQLYRLDERQLLADSRLVSLPANPLLSPPKKAGLRPPSSP